MASDLVPRAAIFPAGRRFAVVPVGLITVFQLPGNVLKNQKMDGIRLFLHTTAHRASHQTASDNLCPDRDFPVVRKTFDRQSRSRRPVVCSAALAMKLGHSLSDQFGKLVFDRISIGIRGCRSLRDGERASFDEHFDESLCER